MTPSFRHVSFRALQARPSSHRRGPRTVALMLGAALSGLGSGVGPTAAPAAAATTTVRFDDGRIPANWTTDAGTTLSIARSGGQRGTPGLVATGSRVVLRVPLQPSDAVLVRFAVRVTRATTSSTAAGAVVNVQIRRTGAPEGAAPLVASAVKVSNRYAAITAKTAVDPAGPTELVIDSGALPLVLDDLSGPIEPAPAGRPTTTATRPPSSAPPPASTAAPTTPPTTAPRPTGITLRGFTMPSLDDEKATYARLGWGYDEGALPPPNDPQGGVTLNPRPEFINLDTEGDDVWTSTWMWKRTGLVWYRTRAAAWVSLYLSIDANCAAPDRNVITRSYCNDLINDSGSHLYGWGLVDWYAETGDEAALNQAEAFARKAAELHWSKATPGQVLTDGGGRDAARYLMLVNRLAEVTGKPEWASLRAKLVSLFLKSPDWVTGGALGPAGIYTQSAGIVDRLVGTGGAFASGVRGNETFIVGIIAAALIETYRATGDPALRERLVAMARFVDRYGLGQCPDGTEHGRYFMGATRDGAAIGQPVCDFVSYSTSLVNLLVFAHKATGERGFYERALVFFGQGSKFAEGTGVRLVPNDRVHHFVDTTFAGPTFYGYNNGELQYCYLLFENGGQPSRLPA